MTPETIIADTFDAAFMSRGYRPAEHAKAAVDALNRAGFSIVPTEPTAAMNKAGNICCMDACIDTEGDHGYMRMTGEVHRELGFTYRTCKEGDPGAFPVTMALY